MGQYTVSFIIVLVYLVILSILGLYGYRYFTTKSVEGYVLGGRAVGWFLAGSTLMAAQYSAFMFLGAAGLFYKTGLSGYLGFCGMYIGFSAAYWLIFGGRMWKLGREFHHATPSDTFSHFYESKAVGYVVAFVLVLALLPYLQTQLMGGAYLLQVASGGLITYAVGVFIIYGIIAFYTILGGMHSIVYADAFQGILLTIALVGGAFLIANFGGGVANIFNEMAKNHSELLTVHTKGAWNWTYMTTWAIAVGLGWPHHPHMWMRMHISKTSMINRLWPFWVVLSFPIVMIGAYLIGTTGLITLPSKINPDLVLPLVIKEHFPVWILGIVCAGGLAALISSLAGQLHGMATVISKDMVRIQEREISETRRVSIVRWIVALGALGGVILAFVNIQLIAAIGALSAALGTQVLPVAVSALIGLRWVTKQGAIASLVGGTLVTLITAFYKPLVNPLGVYCGTWGLIAGIVLLIAVSLLTPKGRPSENIILQYSKVGW